VVIAKFIAIIAIKYFIARVWLTTNPGTSPDFGACGII
jgi:hypothetical protein